MTIMGRFLSVILMAIMAIALPAQEFWFRIDRPSGTSVDAKELDGDPIRIGSLRMEMRTIKKGHVRAILHAEGPPLAPAWSPEDGDPQSIIAAGIIAPQGWLPLEPRGYRIRPYPGQPGTWILIARDDPRPRHARAEDASTQAHMIDGGAQIWWDFVAPGVEPYPLPSKKSEAFDRAVTWLELDANRAKAYPLRAKVRSLFSEGGDYDLGWWCSNYNDRWGGRYMLDGPSMWGKIPWSEGGDCNGHYDILRVLIEQFVATGDVNAWRLACRHARHRICSGFVWAPGRFSGGHRFEKTTLDQTGDYRWPEASHEWDPGLILWALLSGDPMAIEAVEYRANALVRLVGQHPERAWPGRYGIRGAAWTLRNLRAIYVLLGVKEAARAADHLIDWCMAPPRMPAGSLFWPNPVGTEPGPGARSWSPWMQLMMMGECLPWMTRLGIGKKHLPRIVNIATYQRDNVWRMRTSTTGSILEVPYAFSTVAVDDPRTPAADAVPAGPVWKNQHTMTGWALRPLRYLVEIDPAFREAHVAATRTVWVYGQQSWGSTVQMHPTDETQVGRIDLGGWAGTAAVKGLAAALDAPEDALALPAGDKGK